MYDQSGFDGLPKAEPLAPIGTDERLIQRARSAANIWVTIYINIYSLKASYKARI